MNMYSCISKHSLLRILSVPVKINGFLSISENPYHVIFHIFCTSYYFKTVSLLLSGLPC